MAPRVKSIANLIVKVGIAAALITFLVRSGHLDPHQVWDLITPFNVAIAVTLVGFTTLLSAWRWIVLLKTRGLHLSFGYGLRLYLIGMFFNYALPGAVSGDLVRAYYLVQDYPDRKMDSALSVLIDRVLGLYSYFVMSLLAIAMDWNFVMGNPKLQMVALSCLALFLGMTVFFALSFSRTLYRKSGLSFILQKVGPLHRLMEGVHRFGQNPPILALSVASSVVAQLFTMVFFYQLAVMMHEPDITWPAILFAVPMGFVVTAVPIAPAGVGVGQVAFLYLFQTYVGHPTQFGSVSITAFQLCMAIWALVGVVFYLRRRKSSDHLSDLTPVAV